VRQYPSIARDDQINGVFQLAPRSCARHRKFALFVPPFNVVAFDIDPGFYKPSPRTGLPCLIIGRRRLHSNPAIDPDDFNRSQFFCAS
jgi:hypothetical protein